MIDKTSLSLVALLLSLICGSLPVSAADFQVLYTANLYGEYEPCG